MFSGGRGVHANPGGAVTEPARLRISRDLPSVRGVSRAAKSCVSQWRAKPPLSLEVINSHDHDGVGRSELVRNRLLRSRIAAPLGTVNNEAVLIATWR